MTYQTLLFDLRDAIAFITINRPDKLNALNDQVVDELADAAERVATEDAIKGAILSGAGQKAFVAGADIADLAKQGDRKSTRLNSSHTVISYAVFCLKNKKKKKKKKIENY